MMNLRDKRPSLEAAWRGYRDLVLSSRASADQIREARLAFWAGASILFYSIMAMMDEGAEPAGADLSKMVAIYKEVERFSEKFDEEVIRLFGGRQ